MRSSFAVWGGCLLLLFSVGCGSKAAKHRDIVGTWQMQPQVGIYMVLSLHNNGTFKVDERIEGDLFKIIKKRGKAGGTWQIGAAEKQLTLVTRQGDAQIGWPAGSAVYTIAALGSEEMKLVYPDGKQVLWRKVVTSKQDAAKAHKAQLTLTPIVVNLAPSKTPSYHHYEWICTQINMTLERYDKRKHLSAQVREKIIFFLNSKTYEDMNTANKLAAAAGQLKNALNPYLDNRIVKLAFSHTLLTGRDQVVKDFEAKYAVSKKKKAAKR